MTHSLPPRGTSAIQPWRPPASMDTGGGEIKPHQVIGLFVRNRWLIAGCAIAAATVAAVLTASLEPVFEAVVTLRIGDRDQNVPGIYKQLSTAAQVETEAEVLRGRILAADAVDSLALQLRLIAPVRGSRARLLDQIQVSKEAPRAVYELERREDGRFRVVDRDKGTTVAWVRPGERVQLPGVSFRLAPSAASTPKLAVEVRSYEGAIEGTVRDLQVFRPSRDALVLRLLYRDEDRDLAYQVPNLVVRRFIERRQESLQQDAHSTVEFLHRQIDTVALQLRSSEDSLRSYRERHRITDPQTEANNQISRLMTLQAQRTTLDAERTALAQLLAEVDAKAATKGSEEASPYRQLMAFPTLLQSRAATEVLQTLSNVEQERSVLLARRLPSDPDVQVLTDRVNELQMQLRGVVVTYIQSLANQVGTLDAAAARYQQDLAAVPEKELEIARLARRPQVLAGLSSELQTRLKEAEIAQAARDPSVTLVDPAVRPLRPNDSYRLARVLAGLLGGLILGVGVAVIKDARDKSVHTQADLHSATGLPVLGLIPRISGRVVPVALIADQRPVRVAPRQLPARSPRERAWTFLRGSDPAELGTESAMAPQQSSRLVHIAASEVGGAVAEAYGILQTNIVFARSDRPVQIILLTSPLPGEGKTTSAINLALTLAQRGLKVLLIDADLRRGLLHGVFENVAGPGLSEVLEGKETFARAHGIAAVGQDYTMHYLTAGKPDGNPSGLVASHEMRGLLERLREEYDTIVVDSPPVNVVSDASLLATLADGVIVVARSGVTEPAALGCALQQLEHVGAPVLGMLLNDVDPKRDAAYGGSYRHHDYGRYAHSSGA